MLLVHNVVSPYTLHVSMQVCSALGAGGGDLSATTRHSLLWESNSRAFKKDPRNVPERKL
jgi:hypothetical protein